MNIFYHLPFRVGFAHIINAFIYWMSREIKTIWPKLSLAIYRIKKPALELVVISARGTGCCYGRGAWCCHGFLSKPVLVRMLTTPAQPKSSSHHFYPEPFEVLSFNKCVLTQLLLHHNKPIPYRLNLPLWTYQDNRRSCEPEETEGNLFFQITATYILLLIRSILSLENGRFTTDTFVIAFISGESNCHKWKKKITELKESSLAKYRIKES